MAAMYLTVKKSVLAENQAMNCLIFWKTIGWSLSPANLTHSKTKLLRNSLRDQLIG